MNIRPGETDAAKRTVFFELYTADGLLASGGSDGDYEGAAFPGSPTLTYEHDIDGWSAATGTFGVSGDGEFYYTFSLAETAASLAEATIAVRIDGGASFRRQVVRVIFGKGIQPGETVAAKRRIWMTLFTSSGLLANGGANAAYEGTLITAPTVEYAHNLDAFGGAAGALHYHASDEWYYDPTDAETSAGLAKGTIAVRVSKTGFRTNVMRVGVGEDFAAIVPAPPPPPPPPPVGINVAAYQSMMLALLPPGKVWRLP